ARPRRRTSGRVGGKTNREGANFQDLPWVEPARRAVNAIADDAGAAAQVDAEQPAADHLDVGMPLADLRIVQVYVVGRVAADQRERLARGNRSPLPPVRSGRRQLEPRGGQTRREELFEIALTHDASEPWRMESGAWSEKVEHFPPPVPASPATLTVRRLLL